MRLRYLRFQIQRPSAAIEMQAQSNISPAQPVEDQSADASAEPIAAPMKFTVT